MTRKKNAEAPIDPDVANALSELFTDSDDNVQFDFAQLDYSAFGRLLTAAIGLGGMASVYRGRDGDTFIIAIRAGERRKSWEFSNIDECNVFIEQLSNPWYTAYGRYLAAKKASSALANGKGEASKHPSV